MLTLESSVDTSGETFLRNRETQLAAVHALDEQLELARAGGGTKYAQRHHQRGRLLVRERVELLLDRDAPFLELSPLAAWGTQFTVGASILTGIGVVSGVECVLIAHDPTVRGGAMNPYTLRKTLRALEIARTNRLPVINLVESGGADLPTQSDLFVGAGKIFHDLTELSAMGIPTIALVFGNSTAGGAYVPGMCDYAVLVDGHAKVFLGGPPLVKMATGEDADDEQLGGAAMHSRVSGLSDHFAVDELDCIRIGRQIVAQLNWRKLGPRPVPAGRPAAVRPRGAARHRLGGLPGAVRPARGARPRRRRLPVRRVQAAVRHQPGHRVGVRPRLPGRDPGQRPWRAVQRGGQEGQRVHPAGQPDQHPAGVPAEHHRLHGRHRLRAGRDHQGRRQDDQRRHQQHGAAHHDQHRRLVRRRATTACPGGPTTRGSCSPGPTPSSR